MSNTIELQTPAERAKAAIAKHGLSINSVFVPFSKSKNAKPQKNGKPWPCLNWHVTLLKGDRAILATDYSAGEGHCPSYKRGRRSIMEQEHINFELEHGRKWSPFGGSRKDAILPDSTDVLYSLLSDSDVLDCSTFEEWAGNLGFDADSRSAETTYRACLVTALTLRNALGETALAELREAFQDY